VAVARECGGVIDHVSLQVSDVPASVAFYRAVLSPLGIHPAPASGGVAVGFFGPERGSFWLSPAEREGDRELHIAFRAMNRDAVHVFHQAALAIGAEVLHAPRLFPEYHSNYYAAFIRDPDGHNIEAVCSLPEGG
jgi:catechol 2,3-dioxygenase-like lactoylglutathione lyase family enzyme